MRINAPKRSNLSDEDFLKWMSSIGGTPPELLANPEVMKLFLPALKADLHVVENYGLADNFVNNFVLTKSSWFRLQVDLLTSPAGVTNQRAHSCLAQSHVLTERMTFLTTYRVSALLTISSQYILYQIWQRCLMIRAELSVLTVSNHFDILQPNDSERKRKGQS